MDDPEVDCIVGFHLTADPVQVTINRRIAAPGVKPDGLAPGLLLDGLPAFLCTGRGCQQQTGQKRA